MIEGASMTLEPKSHRRESTPPAVSAEFALDSLTSAVQDLSLAGDAENVQRIACTTARRLTGADGATIVLRDGEQCFYVDEDAIAPLWKGSRFPLTGSVSGWSIIHREPVVIRDVYADDRVPHESYLPTFVQSLMVVPIRTVDPIGAIGTYWATDHQGNEREVGLARALADSTAIALENVQQSTALDDAVQLSKTDPLTGLANRRAWEEALGSALGDGPPKPLCVAVMDLDHLKTVNDTWGHAAGDHLLEAAATAWREILRDRDMLARLGGDEFAVMLRGCELRDARFIAERLRGAVPHGQTASVGLASWDRVEDAAALMARADEALYRAKGTDRDRVVLAA